jgi:hypothetical protein
MLPEPEAPAVEPVEGIEPEPEVPLPDVTLPLPDVPALEPLDGIEPEPPELPEAPEDMLLPLPEPAAPVVWSALGGQSMVIALLLEDPGESEEPLEPLPEVWAPAGATSHAAASAVMRMFAACFMVDVLSSGVRGAIRGSCR